MILLSGAGLVLPDRVLTPGTLVIEGDRIVDIRPGATTGGAAHASFAFHDHYIVPGFIDVHVHGVDGVDSLDEGDAVARMATQLPRCGVTAFCPTTVACSPAALGRVLAEVRGLRETPIAQSARVLPAHLESNFISVDYRGAQPLHCLRRPPAHLPLAGRGGPARSTDDFDGFDILSAIDHAAPDVGIVTVAPELDGALDLIRHLIGRGHHVSLGHSGATYDQALAAVSAGARQATHLFNRMPPFTHREPGLVGAILETDEVAAEIICDGFHVHPAAVRTAIAAKRPSRVMAISDGTAASGLPVGATARLGDQPIVVGQEAAFLGDGTLAGSVSTMDRVFRTLVEVVGLSLIDAVTVCSTTPSRELGLAGHGMLAAGSVADLVVLDSRFSVVQTYVAGQLVYSRPSSRER